MLIIFSIICSFFICTIVIWHRRKTKIENRKFQKPGQYIEVFGRRLHTYVQGSGDTTYVLLSGFATSCPSIDFKPLILELKKIGKVVVVEGFGYGWSDETTRQRENRKIVEEIHEALRKSELKPPYILVVHSLSGIYSLAYCQVYKDEVSGIVALDTTIPSQFHYMREKLSVQPYYHLLTKIGLVRLGLKIFPQIIMPPEECDYSPFEREIIMSKYSIRAYNSNLIEEFKYILKNAKEMEGVTYPSTIPVLCFLSNMTEHTSKNWRKGWYRLHEELLKDNVNKKVILLDAEHYLHWTKGKEIVDEIEIFFKEKEIAE